jgi:hypothetical protein
MSELKDLNSDNINLISNYNSIMEESSSSDDSEYDLSKDVINQVAKKDEVKLQNIINENLIDEVNMNR